VKVEAIMPRKARSLARPLVALLLLAQAARPAASQQSAPPTFPGQVEQVTVDAVVVDKKGVPLRGLSKDDFEILEDGVPQSIASFEAVEVPPAPAAAPKARPRVSTNQEPEDSQGRTFVVLFDDVRLTPAMAHQAKGAVADFLTNGVREGDRVTLVATLAGTWWTTRMEAGRDELIAIVKKLEGRYIPDVSRERMTDFEAKRIRMDRNIDVAERVMRRFEQLGVPQVLTPEPSQNRYFATSINPYVELKATEVYQQSTVRSRTTLAILERTLEALNATRGRKSVILLSAGFIWDPNLDEFKRVSRAARRANAAIYFVNAEGLRGLPYQFTAQFGAAVPEMDLGVALTEDFWDAEGAESVAAESGGFTVRDTNDLSAGIKRIADENSSYYLLGYSSTNPALDGAFRKITVQVRGKKDVSVRARKGYYAPSNEPDKRTRKPGVDAVFQEALDSPLELSGFPLRMTHFVGDEAMLGKAKVEIVTEVDLGALNLEASEGRYLGGVEFLLVAAERETGDLYRYDQKIELKLLPATRDNLLKTGFPIRREFTLRPGTYQAKLVARDMRSGRVATVVHEFEVPALTEFRTSTPVLTDDPDAGAGAEGVAKVARRAFGPGQLFCQVEVYGAQKDGAGVPRVGMGYVLRGGDGQVVSRIEPTPINPTSIGKLSRVVRLDLEKAAPGDYELVMAFMDMVAGKMIEVREAFSVVPEAQAPAASARNSGFSRP
jgi:VWFA-related protein